MPIIFEEINLSSLQRIRDEAERRIQAGIIVNGAPFRADDTSTQRIGEMVAAFAAGLVGPDGVTFRTAGGAAFTLTLQSEAEAIRDALLRHRAGCLATSAALQNDPPADPSDPSYWPTPESISL